MHSKSDDIAIMINDKADAVIKELQNTSMFIYSIISVIKWKNNER